MGRYTQMKVCLVNYIRIASESILPVMAACLFIREERIFRTTGIYQNGFGGKQELFLLIVYALWRKIMQRWSMIDMQVWRYQ